MAAVQPIPPCAAPVEAAPRGMALVVDDEPLNVMLLETMLCREGYAVVTAANGAEAVAQFERERPDLVLLDVMMPEMDGYEAARRIKAACGETFLPIIFLTALSDEVALSRCIEAGGDDFLVKPFKQTLLRAKIRAMERIRDLARTVQSQHAALALAHDAVVRDQQLAERVMANAVNGQNAALERLHTLIQPATTFNGDILLTARHPSGALHILLGDFTGHGLAAAIGALPVVETFRTMTAHGFSGPDILRTINRKLHELLPTGMFMAGCFVALHDQPCSIAVWNGGMPELLVLDGCQGGVRARVDSAHLPLGILPQLEDADVALTTLPVCDCDRVFVYSDGLIEAWHPDGERYGQERIERLMADKAEPQTLMQRLGDSVAACRAFAPIEDDVTAALIPWAAIAAADAQAHAAPPGSALVSAVGHWRWAIDLLGPSLRTIDPIPLALSQLDQLAGFGAHRQVLYTILSELYHNALDHGVLRLNSALKRAPDGFQLYYAERDRRLAGLHSGYVHLEFVYSTTAGGGRLAVRIRDSGEGFDHVARLRDGPDPGQTNGFSGRGIALVRSLCESLHYEGCGNRAEAVYVWCDAAQVNSVPGHG